MPQQALARIPRDDASEDDACVELISGYVRVSIAVRDPGAQRDVRELHERFRHDVFEDLDGLGRVCRALTRNELEKLIELGLTVELAGAR